MFLLELFAVLLLWRADFKHRYHIRKKEKADGINRPLNKTHQSPSVKIYLTIILVTFIFSKVFRIYQRRIIYPRETRREMIQIGYRAEIWYRYYGEYPKSIEALIENSPNRKSWNNDAWGKFYRLEVTNNRTLFKITSGGLDNEFGTSDDIKYP